MTFSTPKRFVWNCVSAAIELGWQRQHRSAFVKDNKVVVVGAPRQEIARRAGEEWKYLPSLLEDGLNAVAGVVDDNIDTTEARNRLFDALLDDLDLVRDVELDETQPCAIGAGEDAAELVEVARSRHDAIAACKY